MSSNDGNDAALLQAQERMKEYLKNLDPEDRKNPHAVLFLQGQPDLSDAAYVSSLKGYWTYSSGQLFAYGAFSILFLLLFFVYLKWVTSGFSQWKTPSLLGGILLVICALLPVLPIAAVWLEKAPLSPYQLPAASWKHLQVQRARVTQKGIRLSTGNHRSYKQRLYWAIDGQTISGSTPWMPGTVTAFIREGASLYIATDPKGEVSPIFLGIEGRAPF